MKFNDITQELKRGHFKAVYLLHGDESYFIDTISSYIQEHLIPETEKDFNQSVLYASDVTLGQVLEAAKRFPMMAEKQLVILKEAQQFKADQWETLIPYFEQPLESTVLVIEHKHKKADSRKKWVKSIAKAGVSFESKKLYENQLPGWIHDYLVNKDYRIGQKSSLLLASYLGNDLSKVTNELNKLLINLPEGTTINENHIEQNIGISKDYNVFELQNAIGQRDFAKAISIARYFGQNPKNHPIFATIPVLLTYFSKLLGIHFAHQNKLKRNDILSNCGIPPFLAESYFEASRNFTGAQCAKAISLIRMCDQKVKGVDSAPIEQGEALIELLTLVMLQTPKKN